MHVGTNKIASSNKFLCRMWTLCKHKNQCRKVLVMWIHCRYVVVTESRDVDFILSAEGTECLAEVGFCRKSFKTGIFFKSKGAPAIPCKVASKLLTKASAYFFSPWMHSSLSVGIERESYGRFLMEVRVGHPKFQSGFFNIDGPQITRGATVQGKYFKWDFYLHEFKRKDGTGFSIYIAQKTGIKRTYWKFYTVVV